MSWKDARTTGWRALKANTNEFGKQTMSLNLFKMNISILLSGSSAGGPAAVRWADPPAPASDKAAEPCNVFPLQDKRAKKYTKSSKYSYPIACLLSMKKGREKIKKIPDPNYCPSLLWQRAAAFHTLQRVSSLLKEGKRKHEKTPQSIRNTSKACLRVTTFSHDQRV